MKKIYKSLLVLMLTFTTLVIINRPTTIDALGSFQKAVISGVESQSDYGGVLIYPNAENRRMYRENYVQLRNFLSSDNHMVWTTISPDDGIQDFETGSLEFYLSNNYHDDDHTIQEMHDNGFDFKFYVTTDYVNFVEATDELDFNTETHAYSYAKPLVGYKLSVDKLIPGAVTDKTVAIALNHNIELNYNNMTQGQLEGYEPLESWNDSRSANQPATPNHQNIYVIQPEISGTIKHQIIDDGETPVWNDANLKEGVSITLVENTPAGDVDVATTTTDANGKFIFSNTKGAAYSFTDSHNTLTVRINHDGYKLWDVNGAAVTEASSNEVLIGRITDISRYQPDFNTAISKTNWKSPFDTQQAEGENALGREAILTENPIIEGTLNVSYVDTDGNTLEATKTTKEPVGTPYDTEKLLFPGYTFKVNQGDSIKGNYIDGVLNVVYVYEKDAPIVIPQKGTVNAHYVDENGNVIADLETTTGDVGTSYKTIQKIVDGYTFKEVKGDNVDGLYIKGTLNVTYIYSPKNTPTPEKPVPTPTPETPTPENPTPETPTLPQTGIQANDTGAMILIAGVLVCVGSLLNQKNRKGQS